MGRRRRLAGLQSAFVGLAALAWGAAAHADAGPPTVVLYVEGPAMAEVAQALVAGLPEGAETRPPRPFRRTFGHPPLGPEPERWLEARDRTTFLARVERATASAGARFAILASTRMVDGGDGLEVWIAVIGGGDGEAAVRRVERVRLEAGAAAGSAAASRNAALVSPVLNDGLSDRPAAPPAARPPSAPPASEPAAAATPAPAAAPPSEPSAAAASRRVAAPRTRPDDDAGDSALAWYRVEVGAEIAGRSFVYIDRLSPNLRPYRAFGTPLVMARATVHPLESSEAWALRALGIYGELGHAPKSESVAPDGTRIENRWTRFDAGAVFRVPVSEGGGSLGASAGYGGLRFGFLDAGDLADEVPDVAYRWLRFGVHGSVAHRQARLEAGAAWLAMLTSGETAGRFSGSRVGGLEAEIAVRWRLSRLFEARSGLRYTRVFYDIQPVLGDAFVAGGALDEYVGLVFSVAFRS
jgi:hypothetical protein